MTTGNKTSYPKEKIRILFLENISDVAVRNFRQQGYVQVEKISKALSEEELAKEIKDVHILGIRSKTQCTKSFCIRDQSPDSIFHNIVLGLACDI